jgi:hypothetical protein
VREGAMCPLITLHNGALGKIPSSLAFLEACRDRPEKCIEIDVRSTLDQVAVFRHDQRVLGKDNSYYTIETTGYFLLKEQVPDLLDLDTVFSFCKESGLCMNIDLKNMHVAESMAKTVLESGFASSVLVSGCHCFEAEYFHTRYPSIRCLFNLEKKILILSGKRLTSHGIWDAVV